MRWEDSEGEWGELYAYYKKILRAAHC